MVLKCEQSECTIIFDGPEEYAFGQMVGHLKGTHGIDSTIDSLKNSFYKSDKSVVKTIIEPKVIEAEKVEIETIDVKPKEKEVVKVKKETSVLKRLFKKSGKKGKK